MTAHRREFLLWFVASLAALSGLFAQSKRGPIVIGWLAFGSRESSAAALAAFKEGLAALGWKENAQFVIEGRWADGRPDRLPASAQELAAIKPAVIVAVPLQSVHAAVKAAPGIPIVQATGGDLVAARLAASLSRPGGMVTGIINLTVDLSEKYVELLAAAAPRLRRIGILVDRNTVNRALHVKGVQRSTAHHSLDARIAEVAKPEDIEAAIADLAKQGVEALIPMPSSLLAFQRQQIRHAGGSSAADQVVHRDHARARLGRGTERGL